MARTDNMTASSTSRKEANKEILEESEHALVQLLNSVPYSNRNIQAESFKWMV
jgi:hypothetical protein